MQGWVLFGCTLCKLGVVLWVGKGCTWVKFAEAAEKKETIMVYGVKYCLVRLTIACLSNCGGWCWTWLTKA